MKKIPTLFVRNPDDRRYVTNEVTPGCEWVLAGEGVPTRKYDGTCVRIENDDVFAIWTRREIKPGKPIPNGFVEVERDEVTGKVIGWEPWLNSPFAQFIQEAGETWADAHPLPDPWHSRPPTGTYELIGPKINGNPERMTRHALVPHATAERLYVPGELSFDSLALWMAGTAYEGIVWHHPDGRMAKLKARDFPRRP